MRKLRTATLIIGLFFFILPFQNCSLSQSEGRKFLLSTNPEDLVLPDSSSSALGKLTQDNCLPVISNSEAEDSLTSKLDLKLYYNSESNQTSCLASHKNHSGSALETVVCTVSESNLQISKNFEEFLSINTESVQAIKNEETSYIHLPLLSINVIRTFDESESMAVRCTYVFLDDFELEDSKTEALFRAKKLADAITKSAL